MRWPILLVMILAIASASAASIEESRYVVIVGESAPAADVVTAANFAASMKATSGVEYASALDTDAYATLTDNDMSRKNIIIIDGRSVRIIGTDRAAQAYFEQQGFSIEMISDPSRDDLLLDPAQAARPDTTDEAPVEESETPDGIVPPAAVQETPRVTPTPEPVLTVENRQAPEPLPQPDEMVAQPAQNTTGEPAEPSVATRIWRWFASLF